jgi:hypothetical protein
MTTINFTISGDYLLSGDEQGAVMIWNSTNVNDSKEVKLENSLRTTLYPIVSAKWFTYKPFSETYRFVCLVQDCTAQLYQFQFADTSSYARVGKTRLKSKINLLCVLHLYDELKVKSPLWTYNVQSCDYLMLDKNSPAIGIVWPEKVSYKIIADKKVTCFENRLKIALLYDCQNPKVGNPLTSIPSSLPIERYVPGYNGSLKLEADAYVFYLDKNKQNVCSYCNSSGETKILFNIVKETDTHLNRYSKFEVRPKSGGGLYETYRFLIRSEIDRQYNMCFIFAYNMQKKRFAENVKQFSGIDCIFIGDQTDDSPALVILQEDMQTILISELKVKDEIGLPRGDVKLTTQVKSLYPTPFRSGLAVLYVCQNKLRFSNNRIEDNSFDDFKILEGTRDYFRLNYDEVVFNIIWQA